jgi:hypothetical protein
MIATAGACVVMFAWAPFSTETPCVDFRGVSLATICREGKGQVNVYSYAMPVTPWITFDDTRVTIAASGETNLCDNSLVPSS